MVDPCTASPTTFSAADTLTVDLNILDSGTIPMDQLLESKAMVLTSIETEGPVWCIYIVGTMP